LATYHSVTTSLQLLRIFIEISRITSIPVEIRSLSYLKRLNISNNPISSLPAEIHLLCNLIEINCSRTFLKEFPNPSQGPSGLVKLEKLDLFGCHFSQVPSCISQFVSLQWFDSKIYHLIKRLDMSNNFLRDFSVTGSVTVKSLCLNNNKLKSLPDTFSALFPKISRIYLSKNIFETFPIELLTCKNLLKIDSQNKIATLQVHFFSS
jgi:Leucine-rich repeat (LRR) protein